LSPRAFAALAFSGLLFDGLGGLYLAYDLLGGADGPLSVLTRCVTYSLIFGMGYTIPFGPVFGIIAGSGAGVVLALEFRRVAHHQRLYASSPLYNLPLFGFSRGFVLGLAAIEPFGWRFGLLFGVFSAIGLSVLYHFRFAPTQEYKAHGKLSLDRHRLLASTMRGLVIGLAGVFAGWIVTRTFYSIGFGLTIGLTVGVVSAVVSMVSPWVEWRIDHTPERNMGVLGVVLILIGLVLQSSQYLYVFLK